jgi:hypothetical protein
VVVALVIGGLIGYLIGWNLAPADTETVTVTDTVTETAAPPAYTAGTEMEALVTFDGTSCTYAGPTEVNAGTRGVFSYAATVMGSTLVVWQVEPGTTYEQVIEASGSRYADGPPFLYYWKASEPGSAPRQTLSMSLIAGTYVVSCVENASFPWGEWVAFNDDGTNEVFTSTMIRVLPG